MRKSFPNLAALRTLAFADLKSAKAALHIDADRVRDLITLGACYAARAD